MSIILAMTYPRLPSNVVRAFLFCGVFVRRDAKPPGAMPEHLSRWPLVLPVRPCLSIFRRAPRRRLCCCNTGNDTAIRSSSDDRSVRPWPPTTGRVDKYELAQASGRSRPLYAEGPHVRSREDGGRSVSWFAVRRTPARRSTISPSSRIDFVDEGVANTHNRHGARTSHRKSRVSLRWLLSRTGLFYF